VPGAVLTVGLHQFVYNHGTGSVELEWQDRGGSAYLRSLPAAAEAVQTKWRRRLLQPADSACIAPLVSHRFNRQSLDTQHADTRVSPNGTAAAVGFRLYIVRIPGSLTVEVLEEFSMFSRKGRSRVGRETLRWFSSNASFFDEHH